MNKSTYWDFLVEASTSTNLTGLRNCHARGVDSIVLSTYPDGRPKIRMFIARGSHELWKNTPWDNSPMSIAFHRHRARVELCLLAGSVWNVSGSFSKRGILHPFQYESAILGKGCGFVALEGKRGVFV